MNTWKTLVLALALLSVAAPLVAPFPTWLSPGGKGGVFVVAPALAVAGALVLYFNWRAKLKRQVLAQDDRGELVRAA